jgi:biopolymer transport protein ExbD
MAASLGSGASRHNVDLNLVPMIDLMSCLTAFLLVTAVWVNTAQLDVRAAGRGAAPAIEAPRIGVLVEADRLWLMVSQLQEVRELPDVGGAHDFTALALALRELAARPELQRDGSAAATDVSVAAQSTAAQPVSYQELIAAVDAVQGAGFERVGISDVAGLPLPPQR